MAELGVNIDHIATLRQARLGIEPEPVLAAAIAEQNGADQITIHLREDRRHIQERDLRLLKETVQTRLNLEMAAVTEMVKIALQYKPQTVTLVPEKRQELTTEGGLALRTEHRQLITELQQAGIEVSVFIEPDNRMINMARELGADAVEIHTGHYSGLKSAAEIQQELIRIRDSAVLIKELGMRVAAGHGLNYHNVQALVELNLIEEYNIGHSIISRAVFTGLAEAVLAMKQLIY
ncbi:MAG: pyridoxine 5'-phosphate synthase [Candidatus Cloacimonetes bacterium]|nr:pyridoxine 5'-phosphate synthase [Candidatus Cloacimonadota bacterium]